MTPMVKDVEEILTVLGSSKGRTTRRILSRTWEPGGGWPQQEADTVDTELKDKLPREQPMASGQKRRWESGARHLLAMTALHLGIRQAYDGSWNRIQQHWDVIELFPTWQFRQLGDEPHSLMTMDSVIL